MNPSERSALPNPRRCQRGSRFERTRGHFERTRARWVGTARWIGAACLAATMVGCAIAPIATPSSLGERPPEAGSGYQTKPAVLAQHAISVTANPLASRTAQRILRAGGSAADAAIAAQWVLALVEPQSSGLGGGAVMLYYDHASRATTVVDGRETAPAQASESLFIDSDGKPVGFEKAVIGGRAVGVPGAVAALALLHQRFGKLPWPRLFDDAIALARNGFELSPRLHKLLSQEHYLRRDPVAAAYFFNASGEPWPVGHRLRNPALATTLESIAQHGAAVFYSGPIAQAMVSKVKGHPSNPGQLSMQDMADYRPLIRDPVCAAWLRYLVCGMPPPSSGGIAVLQIIGMLEALARERGPLPLADRDGYHAPGVHRFVEAARLAYADRGRYIADPAFADWPRGLLDPRYLARRAALIDDGQRARQVDAGTPVNQTAAYIDASELVEETGTSHWSIADAFGNMIAITSTIEDAFGSRQMVAGFLLNNQLTDFSFAALGDGKSVANRVQPRKRPRSSMAPTLVFERRADGSAGRWLLSLGSPGGAQIIAYVARVLVATLADGVDLDRAIALPNIGSRGNITDIESGLEQLGGLTALGHQLRQTEMTSGLHGIMRRCQGATNEPGSCTLTAGADPRREGVALAD